MSRVSGTSLTPALLERLSQGDLPARLGIALPFVTVDEAGRPHAMLLSYLELRAYDRTSVGLVIQSQSGSARNLVERHAGTLMIVEPDVVAYVKLRRLDGPTPVARGEEFGLGYFLLDVEEVREDAAADWEGGMRMTHAVTYAPVPTLTEPWARATLEALAEPRATV
jgi:hypothetical protein